MYEASPHMIGEVMSKASPTHMIDKAMSEASSLHMIMRPLPT